MLPDYQGIGIGKRLLNFTAERSVSQTKVPFYILTSNPQIIPGNTENWKITRFGHASKGKGTAELIMKLGAASAEIDLLFLCNILEEVLNNFTDLIVR